ncbi:MAG: arylsulfatase [Opitutae bacterium]|nr:arylsulfatase [Opitutae bacterium]
MVDERKICFSDKEMIRIFIVLFFALTVLFVFASPKPNILLIMADDMGYSDLGCFGGEIDTPNLDALAGEGVRFTNFYSENMCWVSRASLLTGVYHRTSLKDNSLHPRCLTLPGALAANGYRTAIMGKWHLAGNYDRASEENAVFPDENGFNYFYGILGGASSFFAPIGLKRNRTPIDHEFINNPEYYFTNAIGKEALSFLKKPRDKPFFLYLPFTAAHWPLHAPSKEIKKYKGKFSAGWDELRKKRLQRMKELGVIGPSVVLSERHPKVPPWKKEENKAWQERRIEVYAAQVSIMDRVIGEVFDYLKSTGQFENTLTFFTIDNGGCHVEYNSDRKGDYLPEKTRDGRLMRPGNLSKIMPGPEITYQSYGHGWANLSNTPFRLFKQYDHEGGIHTPMIAHWPNRIKGGGSISPTLSHLVDLMPTILEATEVSTEKMTEEEHRITWDGRSILPSLLGKKQSDPSLLFFHHARGKAIRTGNWKLVFNKDQKKSAKWELYDLKKDPSELTDLADTNPKKVQELAKLWKDREKNQLSRAQSSRQLHKE